MKASLAILCAAISASLAGEIYLHTRATEKVYNFFPFETDYLEFQVKARNDIHIALTPNPYFGQMYYEIVFGGWANSKSVIRKDNQDNAVATHLGRAIDPDAFATYWIRRNNTEGSLAVGKTKGTDPIMKIVDSEYVKMDYFGVSTGFGSDGTWIINTDLLACEANNDKSLDSAVVVV